MTHLTTAMSLLIALLNQLLGSELGDSLIGGCRKLAIPRPVSADLANAGADKISGSSSEPVLLLFGDIPLT